MLSRSDLAPHELERFQHAYENLLKWADQYRVRMQGPGPDGAPPPERERALQEEGRERERQTSGARRVDTMTAGLYDSIDPDQQPPGLYLEHIIDPDDPLVIRTFINAHTDAGPVRGRMVRRWDPERKQLVMIAAYLPAGIPTRVFHNVALDPNAPEKGVPLATFVQMVQMRKLGVDAGRLQRVHMNNIENLQTIIQLNIAAREQKVPLQQLDVSAILASHSARYVATPMIQTGHKIVGARIIGGARGTLSDILDAQESGDYKRQVEAARRLLADHGLPEDVELVMNFEIELDLAPVDSETP